MEYPHEAYGRIIYDPKRGSMKTRTEWWCVLELEPSELADYYRWWVNKLWWDADSSSIKRNYHRSPHATHISLIRGEQPRKNADQWGKYRANERVKFRYNGEIRQTSNAFYASEPDKFWFIDAEWMPYVGFRQKFGLPWEHNGKPFRPHITIARTYD